MALISCSYFSDVLGLTTHATVLLPQRVQRQIGLDGAAGDGPPPVLYLLHGMSDDDTIWARRTSLERYVADRHLAVVMPAAHRSYYTDQADGYAYFTHIAEELPRVIASFFRVSSRPADTFVAGLSMGGYGAIKLALRHPERYAAAASLSGALDAGAPVADRYTEAGRAQEWRRTFGSPERARDHGDDLLDLARRADPAAVPALWAWCGEQDYLLDGNRAFRDVCAERGIGLDYAESPGDHEWSAWDEGIRRVLDWLPIDGRGSSSRE